MKLAFNLIGLLLILLQDFIVLKEFPVSPSRRLQTFKRNAASAFKGFY